MLRIASVPTSKRTTDITMAVTGRLRNIFEEAIADYFFESCNIFAASFFSRRIFILGQMLQSL
jgi:hypothetical protein